MYITEQFKLPQYIIDKLSTYEDPFKNNFFGKVTFLRTYSRKKEDGTKETWLDTVVRVIEGIFSIRKTHMINSRLGWEEDSNFFQFVEKMATYMYTMKFLPPGRGLAMMGTEKVKNHGSAFLFNCFHSELKDLAYDSAYVMDFLACGIGSGVCLNWEGEVYEPTGKRFVYAVPDDREGWCESVFLLISAYTKDSNRVQGDMPIFDYSLIRPKGAPIKGFGGTASGYEVLMWCHMRIMKYFETYIKVSKLNENSTLEERVKPYYDLIDYFYNNDFYISKDEKWIKDSKSKILENVMNGTKTYSKTRLQADIICSIGICIVAGNIRRSAIILTGRPDDETFTKLKDLNLNPERSDIYWTSNNSVKLETNHDFEEYLPKIADSIRSNGEPGYLNMINIKKYGRMGELKPDINVTGMNPCGEICLENKELCNLAEVFLNMCRDADGKFSEDIFLEAAEYATWYASTVSLLPTHRKESNSVMAKNRRIGVSISGFTTIYNEIRLPKCIRHLNEGYQRVINTNKRCAKEAGVCESIRVTTVKPCGTISKLVGSTPGAHFVSYSHHIRRIRIANDNPIANELIKLGIPYENDIYSKFTYVFSFPISFGRGVRCSKDASMWEQGAICSSLQKFWSDNSVSVTIHFNKNESKDVETFLTNYAPYTKSISMLPAMEGYTYAQLPEEEISYVDYILFNKWVSYVVEKLKFNTEAEPVLYCTGDSCELNYDQVLLDSFGRSEEFLKLLSLYCTKMNKERIENEYQDRISFANEHNIQVNENEDIYCFYGKINGDIDNPTNVCLAVVPKDKIHMYYSKEEYDDEISEMLIKAKLYNINSNMEIITRN